MTYTKLTKFVTDIKHALKEALWHVEQRADATLSDMFLLEME